MKEIVNPEQLYVGDFRGMATAKGQFSDDGRFLNYLMNATIENGVITPRVGSRFFTGYEGANLYVEIYRFTFGGFSWLLIRDGRNLAVFRQFTVAGFPLVERLTFKANVLRQQSEREPATYAVVTNGDYCHIMCATESTQLVGITIIRRNALVATVPNANSYTFVLTQPLSTNLSPATTKVYNTNNNLVSLESGNITQAGSIVTVTSNAHGLAVNDKVTSYSAFNVRYCDANYYPGITLWNSSVRQNTVPLDVNVEVPKETRENYIYNEPNTRIADITPYTAFEQINAGSTPNLPNVIGSAPPNATTYSLSDGAYRAGVGVPNRTADYIAFGGLLSGNISSKIHFARWRNVLLDGTGVSQLSVSSIMWQTDKQNNASIRFINQAFNFFDSQPFYFAPFGRTDTNTPPGIRGDAVFEIVLSGVGVAGVNTIVDLDTSLLTLVIGDGFIVPLYGYNLLCRTSSFSYPNIIRAVGNRLVLSGRDNKVLVGSSDWNYRGLTHNNLQVSSFNLTESSAFLLGLNQANKVVGISEVNGVLVIATDEGIYRVSGKSRTEVPNALIANISKVSNQVITNPLLITKVDNLVYFANEKGLFALEYQKDIEETATVEVSTPVRNLFVQEPQTLSYSKTLNSVLVEMRNQKNKLLRWDTLNLCWSFVGLSVSNNVRLFGELDGYFVESPTGVAFALWNSTATSDLENIENAPNPTFMTLVGNSQLIGTHTNTFGLNTPPELQQTLLSSGTVVPSYGFLFSRAVGSAVTVTEANNLQQPKPIYSSFVTKQLTTDKLSRGLRIRNTNVILGGSGQLVFSVVGSKQVGQQEVKISTISLLNTGEYSITKATNQGSNLGRWHGGDSIVISLPQIDNQDTFCIAGLMSNSMRFIGMSCDISSKQNRLL